ncbi:MAG: hypothetical protein ABUK01_12580 [Leptospirales bacterium]
MPRLRVLWTLLIGLILSASFLNGQESGKFDPRGNSTENYASQGLVLTIHSVRSRYMSDERIVISCKLKNTGIHPITLYLHKNILYNFTIIVRNDSGQSIPLKESSYQKDGVERSNTYFSDYTATNHNSRALILQPGEALVRDMELTELVSFEHNYSGLSRYKVSAYFYPNPEQNKKLFISSQNVYPLFVDAYNVGRTVNATRDTFQSPRLSVSPKELVYLALSAEYNRDWPNYFKYVDLHEVIRDYPEFARQYMQAPPQSRGVVLHRFKEFLISDQNHRLKRFEIISENVEYKKSSVTVKATREFDGFERIFLYTYYLTPKDNLWQITGIESQLEK